MNAWSEDEMNRHALKVAEQIHIYRTACKAIAQAIHDATGYRADVLRRLADQECKEAASEVERCEIAVDALALKVAEDLR